jgi:integrase
MQRLRTGLYADACPRPRRRTTPCWRRNWPPASGCAKSAKKIGLRTGNWLSLKQAQALPNAPDITTTKGLRDRAITAVLLGCALRRSQVAALTDGALFGRIHAGGDGRRTAGGYAGAVGVSPATASACQPYARRRSRRRATGCRRRNLPAGIRLCEG